MTKLSPESMRMLCDLANGVNLQFCIESGGSLGQLLVTGGKLSKRFDKRTFANLKGAGLLTVKRIRHFGIRWESYSISKQGWEVFNACR